jgi:hypothetical protein
MTQGSRRQLLVDQAWPDVLAATAAAVTATPSRDLRTTLGTHHATAQPKVTIHRWHRHDLSSAEAPTEWLDASRAQGAAPDSWSAQLLLIESGGVQLDGLGLAQGATLADSAATLCKQLIRRENQFISRWLPSAPDQGHCQLEHLGHLEKAVHDARTAFDWDGALDVLLSSDMWDTYLGAPDGRSPRVPSDLRGGRVVEAAGRPDHSGLIIRHGTAEQSVGVVSELVLDWDIDGANTIILRATEQLAFNPPQAVEPYWLRVDP